MKKVALIVLALALAASASPAWAGTIILKNGRPIEGKIIKVAKDRVTLGFPFGRIFVKLKRISRIDWSPDDPTWGEREELKKVLAAEQAETAARKLKVEAEERAKEERKRKAEEARVAEEARKKTEELTKASNEQIMGIITAEQKTKWKEMIGEPFDLSD